MSWIGRKNSDNVPERFKRWGDSNRFDRKIVSTWKQPENLCLRTADESVLEVVTNRTLLVVVHPVVHPAPNRVHPIQLQNSVVLAAVPRFFTGMHVGNGRMGKDKRPQIH